MSREDPSIEVGEPAPEIEADAYVRGEKEATEINLEDYRGDWVVLFFYPRDFTFVCPTEIQEFAEHADRFEEENAQLIGASTDSFHVHKAWYEGDERLQDVDFPVIADTTHEVSEAYDVLDEDEGLAMRGTFIIDPDGVVRHMSINHGEVGRSVDEVLRLLRAYRTGKGCPAEWEPGSEHVGPELSAKPEASKWN